MLCVGTPPDQRKHTVHWPGSFPSLSRRETPLSFLKFQRTVFSKFQFQRTDPVNLNNFTTAWPCRPNLQVFYCRTKKKGGIFEHLNNTPQPTNEPNALERKRRWGHTLHTHKDGSTRNSFVIFSVICVCLCVNFVRGVLAEGRVWPPCLQR